MGFQAIVRMLAAKKKKSINDDACRRVARRRTCESPGLEKLGHGMFAPSRWRRAQQSGLLRLVDEGEVVPLGL